METGWMFLLKGGDVGEKKLIDIDAFKAVPLCKRKTLRSTAAAMNVSKTTLIRRLNEGAIRVHTNSMKPKLTPTFEIV